MNSCRHSSFLCRAVCGVRLVLWPVAVHHMSECVASTRFLQLSRPKLCRLLRSDELNIRERELFEAVVRWIESAELKRLQNAPDRKNEKEDTAKRCVCTLCRSASHQLMHFHLRRVV
jgi:hypothetical protein